MSGGAATPDQTALVAALAEQKLSHSLALHRNREFLTADRLFTEAHAMKAVLYELLNLRADKEEKSGSNNK